MTRNGHTDVDVTTFGVMDNLTYLYDSGNKLLGVSDSSLITEGFKDRNTNGDDFSYDDNGNLLSDANKGIINITYNHLNLPTQVTFAADKYITYIYDATGVKLEKIVNDISAMTTTKYAGNYIYENDVLQFFNQPEGYVQPDGSGGFDYVYQYKDHLGNIRLSYSDSDGNGTIAQTEILQERNTYPFGMEHKGYNNIVNGSENNHMTYNGKELDKSLGLNWHDYGARRYDASLGRWMSTDPYAEKYETVSPATALLVSAKIPLLNCIQLTKKMIDFYPLQLALRNVEKEIIQGKELSENLEGYPIFDKKMISLLKVAEQTNQNEYIFDRLTKQYNDDIQYQSKLLSTVLEPLIIVFLGALVAVILVAMYLPMFKLSTVIG